MADCVSTGWRTSIEAAGEIWNALPRRGDEAASWTSTTTTRDPAIDARTLLAGMAMQGLLAGRHEVTPWTTAVEATDALLAELAKEPAK